MCLPNATNTYSDERVLFSGCAFQLPHINTVLSGRSWAGVLSTVLRVLSEGAFHLPHTKTVLSGCSSADVPRVHTVLTSCGCSAERVLLSGVCLPVATHKYSAERVLLSGCAHQLPHIMQCCVGALERVCAPIATNNVSAERVLLSGCAYQVPHLDTLPSRCS